MLEAETSSLTLEEQLEEGRRQWTIAWRRFARQWTQPQLLKLADAVLGGRYLHSSQISGFATGKLREPSPKVFMAIGRLNQAIADGRLPAELKELWDGKQVLKDKDGNPLDAVGCFEAFTGALDLGMGEIRTIPEDQVEEANKRLGRFTRGKLTEAGVDFIESLSDIETRYGTFVRAVILGEKIRGDELAEAVRPLCTLLTSSGTKTTEEDLWKILFTP